MRQFVMLTSVVFILSLLTSCVSANFSNEAEYNKGEWGGYMTAKELAEYKQDKLAFKKLQSLPVYGDNTKGYKGYVTNHSRNRVIKVTIDGPEKKSFILTPGQICEEYLIPGNYTAKSFINNKILGEEMFFQVGPKIQNYQGVNCHWFVYSFTE